MQDSRAIGEEMSVLDTSTRAANEQASVVNSELVALDMVELEGRLELLLLQLLSFRWRPNALLPVVPRRSGSIVERERERERERSKAATGDSGGLLVGGGCGVVVVCSHATTAAIKLWFVVMNNLLHEQVRDCLGIEATTAT
jgi:hypothetical protein